MADEVFWDTSGFFALLNSDDPAHQRARSLAAERPAACTTDAIIGECCTLLVARRKAHLVPGFLDFTEHCRTLHIVHLDRALLGDTKAFLRGHLDHAYSFVDCASFVVMSARRLRDAATTDAHFVQAGFMALLRYKRRHFPSTGAKKYDAPKVDSAVTAFGASQERLPHFRRRSGDPMSLRNNGGDLGRASAFLKRHGLNTPTPASLVILNTGAGLPLHGRTTQGKFFVERTRRSEKDFGERTACRGAKSPRGVNPPFPYKMVIRAARRRAEQVAPSLWRARH